MIADVCGKGMGAALLTASLEALSAGPIEDGQSIDEICGKVCRRLYERTPPTKFATVFLCSLDIASGDFKYLNAGHNPVLLVRAGGSVELLESQSVPIGVIPDADFSEVRTLLNPGDLVVMYTDGITEATDPENNMYSLERLMRVTLEHRNQTLEELARVIDADVTEFAQGEPFADDRTLVLLRRNPD
jgi:sigma-B regulation protein RsbU (phosphoserine phosphatase)